MFDSFAHLFCVWIQYLLELALAFQGYEFYNGTEIEHPLGKSELEFMIDNAMTEDDLNNDGKISWQEYLESQQYHHKLDTHSEGNK